MHPSLLFVLYCTLSRAREEPKNKYIMIYIYLNFFFCIIKQEHKLNIIGEKLSHDKYATLCRQYERRMKNVKMYSLFFSCIFLITTPRATYERCSLVNISTRWLHDKYWMYSTACCLLLYFIQSKFFREHVFDCVLNAPSDGYCFVITMMWLSCAFGV